MRVWSRNPVPPLPPPSLYPHTLPIRSSSTRQKTGVALIQSAGIRATLERSVFLSGAPTGGATASVCTWCRVPQKIENYRLLSTTSCRSRPHARLNLAISSPTSPLSNSQSFDGMPRSKSAADVSPGGGGGEGENELTRRDMLSDRQVGHGSADF